MEMVVNKKEFEEYEREVIAQECIECEKWDDLNWFDDVHETCELCGSEEVVVIHNSDGENCENCGNPLEYDDKYYVYARTGEHCCESCYGYLEE